jgi:ketosteroid isomerase-like protein
MHHNELKHAAELMKKMLDNFVNNPEKIIDLFAEDAVIEFPYAPGEAYGFPKRVEGRAAILKYAKGLQSALRDYKINPLSDWGCYSLSGSKKFLFEYTGDAITVPDNKPYHQDIHAFVEVNHGKITYFEEYWDGFYAMMVFGAITVKSA